MIQIETIKDWMVRYYRGDNKAVLYADHLEEADRINREWFEKYKQRGKEIERLTAKVAGLREAIGKVEMSLHMGHTSRERKAHETLHEALKED